MSDKTSKFPYIVLPNLSSAEDAKKLSIPNAKPQIPRHKFNSATHNSEASVKLPPITPINTDPMEQLNINTSPPPASSNALTRHIALSKQFQSSAAQAKGIKEVQATQKRVLLAHYEMRKSPRSLYPSTNYISHQQEPKQSISTTIDDNDIPRKQSSFEALSQIFPHRIQKARTNFAMQLDTNSRIERSLGIDNNKQDKPNNTVEIPRNTIPVPTMIKKDDKRSPPDLTCDYLKMRVDGLTVHLKNRDSDISQLKQDLIDLQLLVLKERKESEISKNLMESLMTDISTLEEKLTLLERTVACQEKNILNKIFLLDGMDSSDSDSEFGKIENKPCEWNLTSTCPCKSQCQTQPELDKKSKGVGTLKECINWVPVAPDFDKLLGVISSLNFRMDRNQSMKLCRNGNEATFKHADTINLTLFKNGLVLGTAGFRSYATLSIIKFINEMFSGFFPTELHSQFPDGVIFVVTDKRSVLHDMNPIYYGPGEKLSDTTSAPLLIPGLEKLSDFKKPKAVYVIKSADKNLNSASSTSIISSASTSASCISLPDIPYLPPLNKPSSEHNKILLKLKDTFTGKSYKVQVSTCSTVDEIIIHLGKCINNTNSLDDLANAKHSKYDLVLPVPYGILSSGNATLKEYGMESNTLLYIKPTEFTSEAL